MSKTGTVATPSPILFHHDASFDTSVRSAQTYNAAFNSNTRTLMIG